MLEGSASGREAYPNSCVLGRNLAAADVRCLKAFRPLQQIELNRLALVKAAIAIFLNSGEVNKNIFARGPLNKHIALGPVEPLYCTLLSHKVLLSPLLIDSRERPQYPLKKRPQV